MARARLEAQDGFGNRSLLFDCPGCGALHAPRVVAANPTDGRPLWTWNHDLNLPTLQPSVLVTWDRYGEAGTKRICHSCVKDGQIQFLGDCTHEHAGETLDLPEITC